MTLLPQPWRLFAALACILLLASTAAMAYQTSDLAGDWRFHSLASGPGAPWWERANLSIAANGAATGTAVTSAGGSSPIAGTFVVGATGLVSLATLPVFRGALDVDHTVVAATDTWSGTGAGTTELKFGVRTLAPYELSDIAGAWEILSIASGPGAPWWMRGRIIAGVDGNFSGTFTESDGSVSPATGSFGLTPDGMLTFSGSASAQGVLDAGRTVMAMTSTWSGFGAGTADFTIGLKMAPSYALSDLAGTWELAILATGPGAPWWSRGSITIAANGSFSGSLEESSGGSEPVSGTFGLSSGGIVTRNGAATARGALDLGRSVFVMTDTWSGGSPGTSEITVAVRTARATTDAPAPNAVSIGLEPVRPNPSRGTAPVVRFRLASAAPARLELLDVTGRCVTAREVGTLGAGQHAVGFGEESRLTPGLYWVRLSQSGAARVARFVVLGGGR